MRLLDLAVALAVGRFPRDQPSRYGTKAKGDTPPKPRDSTVDIVPADTKGSPMLPIGKRRCPRGSRRAAR